MASVHGKVFNLPASVDETLRHHDQQLTRLNTEVIGIKDTLGQMTGQLGSISAALNDQKANQGPSLARVLTIVVTGGGLVTMASGAITVLVLSLVSPQLSRLDTTSARIERGIEDRGSAEQRELYALRTERDRRQDLRLDRLEAGVSALLRGSVQ